MLNMRSSSSPQLIFHSFVATQSSLLWFQVLATGRCQQNEPRKDQLLAGEAPANKPGPSGPRLWSLRCLPFLSRRYKVELSTAYLPLIRSYTVEPSHHATTREHFLFVQRFLASSPCIRRYNIEPSTAYLPDCPLLFLRSCMVPGYVLHATTR